MAHPDGGTFPLGTANYLGSMGGKPLDKPVVGMAATPDGGGYWEVASDGGVFTLGDTQIYGSMGGKALKSPIVGIAATIDGGGYWEVASDGGVFAFGDAQFYGSMGGKPLDKPIVGMAATSGGRGYWEVASDGGVFAFGDAQFYGSMGGKPLDKPIVGIDASPVGYWEVASDGGIFTFGANNYLGSMGGKKLNKPMVGCGPPGMAAATGRWPPTEGSSTSVVQRPSSDRWPARNSTHLSLVAPSFRCLHFFVDPHQDDDVERVRRGGPDHPLQLPGHQQRGDDAHRHCRHRRQGLGQLSFEHPGQGRQRDLHRYLHGDPR